MNGTVTLPTVLSAVIAAAVLLVCALGISGAVRSAYWRGQWELARDLLAAEQARRPRLEPPRHRYVRPSARHHGSDDTTWLDPWPVNGKRLPWADDIDQRTQDLTAHLRNLGGQR